MAVTLGSWSSSNVSGSLAPGWPPDIADGDLVVASAVGTVTTYTFGAHHGTASRPSFSRWFAGEISDADAATLAAAV